MKALDLSKYIVSFCNSKGDVITNKKLQKLLYYTDAWYAVFNNAPLIEEEFEAWVYGPVVPVVYQYYKCFGSAPIQEVETDIQDLVKELSIKPKIQEIIDAVLLKYYKMSAFELELLSHNETPWLTARANIATHEPSISKISKTLMQQYYSNQLKNIANG